MIAARYGEQRKEEAAGGVFLFGYFILDKQNKVTCCRATPDKTYLSLLLNLISLNRKHLPHRPRIKHNKLNWHIANITPNMI